MTPTEEWRKLIFDLSDQAFFDLVRNYLGDIHTPFNKHKLLDQLEHFLLNRTNLEQLFSMIDSSDAALLSAIDLLGTASVKELYALFSDEKPYYSFYTHLLNLEERMLICPVRGEKGAQSVVISPLFREEIRKKVIDIDLLLGCKKATAKKSAGCCWYDTPVISAAVSWILSKKGKAQSLEYAETVKEILIRQNLFHQSGRNLIPVMENFRKLFTLDNQEIRRFFIQSYLSSDPLEGNLYENMRDDRSYSESAFRRLALCTSYLAGVDAGDINQHKENFLKAGLAVEEGAGLRKVTSVSDPSDGKIVVQPDFSLFVQGFLPFKESIILAFYSEIRKQDLISRYEITRESFMRGIRLGISPSSFIGLLEAKSGSELPQNILFSLKSWEEECQGISVYRGCIIKVDARFSNLLDNNSTFKKYVQEKLSEGIYIISDEDFDNAVKVVENVSGQSLAMPWDKTAESIEVPALPDNAFDRLRNSSRPVFAEKGDVTGKILKKIESLDITKEKKDILSDRFRRKLILSEKQLDGNIRYEFAEAKGIDYTGKVRLCQHVIEAGSSFLELSMGSEGTMLIKPVQMKKVENDLLIMGEEIPDGAQIQIPLRKVRLMRKVRTSLMG